MKFAILTLSLSMTTVTSFVLPSVLFGSHLSPSSSTSLLASRRDFLDQTGAVTAACLLLAAPPPAIAADSSSLADLTVQIKQVQQQLDQIPPLIKEEKWDSVRAVLITPPLSDCWAKSNRPLLQSYAQELEKSGGDELAALEGREELLNHLRYLDMAVYNNIFNPIKTEGESGATKELVRSYYEDPTNEWKQSKAAIDELVELSNL
jgi:hypothetical protein